MGKTRRQRSRRGRPRKDRIPRLASGRLKRGKARKEADDHLSLVEMEDNKSVGIEARQRVFNMSAELADSQDGGCCARRMLLKSTERRQEAARYFDAIDELRRAKKAHDKAILARGVPSGGDLGRTGGFDDSDGTDPVYVAKCRRAVGQWKELRRAILECGQPMAMMAVDAIVFEERDQWNLLGDLRCALNAVNRVLGLMQKTA